MTEVFKNKADVEKWLQVAQDPDNYDFEQIFTQGHKVAYRATVDHPGAGYYKQLMLQYPDAKVILSVRDSPDIWLESVCETIGDFTHKSMSGFPRCIVPMIVPGLSKFFDMIDKTVWSNPTIFGEFEDGAFNSEDKKAGIATYNTWIESVKAHVPASNLLVFNAKQGWEPLCAFLNVAVPENIPYPRVNDRAEMKNNLSKLIYGAYAVAAVGTAVIGTGAFFLAKFALKR
jgi:hypothetical protein